MVAPLVQAGPSAHMNWYSANGNGGTVPAGSRGSDADAMNGNAVMYDAVAGKILTVGGAPSYQVSLERVRKRCKPSCTTRWPARS